MTRWCIQGFNDWFSWFAYFTLLIILLLVLILMVTNRSFHFSASTLTTDCSNNVISYSGTSVGVQLTQVCIAISMSGH